jgi:hypothetical protein
MMRLRRFALMLGVGALAACELPINDAAIVNGPLGDPTGPESESCVGFGNSTQVCVRAGMKLDVAATDAYSGGWNSRTPVLVHSEWLLPTGGTFTQQDMFNLSNLLAGARSESGVFNAPLCLKEWLTQSSRKDFIANFAAPLLATLRVDYEPYNNLGDAKTASHVQGWAVIMPDPLNSINPNPRQAVRFEFPLLPGNMPAMGPARACYKQKQPTVSLIALDGGSIFELADDATTSSKTQNDWSKSTPAMDLSRTLVTVMVPVSVAGETGRRYYPFYYSLCDVERSLGSPIRAIGRDWQLLPPEFTTNVSQAPRAEFHLVPPGHYLATSLPVLEALKPELLVAPHDEYWLGTSDSACSAVAPTLAIP